MQKAWFYEEYGSIEVLKLGLIPVPVPKYSQILVEVRAAALNPIDSILRQRPNFPSCFPVIPGCDMAGVVVAKGNGVSRFKIGDEVYGSVQDFDEVKKFGTLAELIAVEEGLVASKPKNISFEEAASLPVAVQAAIEGLRLGGVREGLNVFVVGGAGGVGSLVVQLAKHVFKASEVVATTSTTKVNFVKRLGADKVIDYTKTGYEEIKEKYDLVFDTVGSQNSHVVAKKDAPVIDLTWAANRRAVHVKLKLCGHILEMLNPYLERGILKAVIDPISPYHFNNVRQAFEHLETGRARGKVVITSFPSQPMSFFL